jgi:hypothetical protein
VSLSAFAFLINEMVQYYQNRVTSIDALERKLEASGYAVGLRVLELYTLREKGAKRRTRLLQVLQFVSADVWRGLFGKTADSLERSTENVDEYMIHEMNPITNTFVSVPADLGQLDVAAFIAGILAGILEGSSFPCRVTAHTVDLPQGSEPPGPDAKKTKTVFLLKFDQEVLDRESRLG